MSLSGMGTLRQSNSDRWRSMRTDPPPINPVIPAAMGSHTVIADVVDYVARLTGYDAEECIQKAIEDGVIELDSKGGWKRGDGVYRFTAKGRKASDEYARGVFERSEEMARRNREEDPRATRIRTTAGAAVGGRPPPTRTEELVPTVPAIWRSRRWMPCSGRALYVPRHAAPARRHAPGWGKRLSRAHGSAARGAKTTLSCRGPH